MNDALDFRLLNEFQRNFPLVPAPFAAMAEQLGVAEEVVLTGLQRLQQQGALSRVGPVFAPHRIGASTLAAMAVPAAQMERVAALISDRREVNHNYLREHRYNLWFVATAPNDSALQKVLDSIARDAGHRVLSLPLLQEYHIDLGFDLAGGAKRRSVPGNSAATVAQPLFRDKLVAALQGGLPLTSYPFRQVAADTGLSEAVVLSMIGDMLDCGIIKRFGVVVRHHELGYRANAMCVWDIPDERVAEFGALLAGEPAVTLCYRRQRALPAWSYNLFCMIHGRERQEVEQQRQALADRHGLDGYDHEILFSTRRFKQCGARYASGSGESRLAACG